MTKPTRTIIAGVSMALAALCSGCAIKTGAAGEIHSTISYPLIFTDQLDATNIKKEAGPNGEEIYKAETLTHTTTVGGFSRNVTYKNVEIQVGKKK